MNNTFLGIVIVVVITVVILAIRWVISSAVDKGVDAVSDAIDRRRKTSPYERTPGSQGDYEQVRLADRYNQASSAGGEIVCERCGTRLPLGTKFCNKCGTSLVDSQ